MLGGTTNPLVLLAVFTLLPHKNETALVKELWPEQRIREEASLKNEKDR